VIEEMAQFIDSLDLEVLALEEVEDAEALDLLLSFMPPGKYAYIVSPQTSPETCQRVAVLYQKEEVAMRYVGEIPLSLGEYGLRDGLVVYGKFLPDGFDFTLVVVHLKAYSDPRSTSIREEELSILGQWVQTYLDDPANDRDLIIARDFNEHLLTNKKSLFSPGSEGPPLPCGQGCAPKKMPELDGPHRSHRDLPGSGIREIRGFLRLFPGSYATG
jgi:hypothetical protein